MYKARTEETEDNERKEWPAMSGLGVCLRPVKIPIDAAAHSHL